ncbi:sugar phosphate permease [Georgenia soli]|uniref:Sugar phosphate permease n=1 Tax=Georgenia soli TaxID=638953 RepID=A0A2A9ELD6_9MICO|nr:MFS transporter [Georgenia soli]PFG39050.1 sugar phosphate permease [Georgenia soli]
MSETTDVGPMAEPTKRSRLEAISATNFRKLMPLLVIVYVISFIDRTNIGMAKEALEVDIGLSAAAYGLGAGLFFAFYALLEIPSNLIMHKVGARFWIARIMITWGIISMAMAIVWNETSFYVLRILLGAAEAGLYPGMILYITYWFPRAHRARAIGIFLLGVSLANVIGAPLGGLLLGLDGMGGLHGWQWMFIIEGLPAVLLAFVVWFWLPDKPHQAKWLTAEDKALLDQQLAAEDDGAASQSHGFKALIPVAKDKIIWLVIAIYFTHQVAVYSLSYFLPSMIRNFDDGMSNLTVGLITAIPWIAAAVGSSTLPRFGTTLRLQKMLVSGGLFSVAVGLVVAATSNNNLVLAVLGFAFAAFWFFVIQSVLFTFPGRRLSGAATAAGIAMVNMFGLLGGFLGPTIMGSLETSTGNPLAGLWFIVVLTVIGSALAWGLKGARQRATYQAETVSVS